MSPNEIISIVIFLAVMAAIISEKVHRAAASIAGAVLLLVTHVLTVESAMEHVDVNTIGVNSYHHQAVKQLGSGLKPMAFSEDGLVEAVYMPEQKFVAAVQWHPEFNYQKEESSRILFGKFVEACGT